MFSKSRVHTLLQKIHPQGGHWERVTSVVSREIYPSESPPWCTSQIAKLEGTLDLEVDDTLSRCCRWSPPPLLVGKPFWIFFGVGEGSFEHVNSSDTHVWQDFLDGFSHSHFLGVDKRKLGEILLTNHTSDLFQMFWSEASRYHAANVVF